MIKYFQYIKYLRGHYIVLLVGVFCGILYGVASGFGVPFFVDKVFTAFFEEGAATWPFTAQPMSPLAAAFLLPVVFLISGLGGYFNHYLLSFCGMQILQGLRQDLFDKLQELPLAYFERESSGDMLSRMISDTTLLQSTLLKLAQELVRHPVQFMGGLGILIYFATVKQESLFVLLFFSILPFVALPVKIIGLKLKKRGRQAQETLSEITQQMSENLQAVHEVRAYNLQKRQSASLAKRLQRYLFLQMKVVKYERLSQPMMELIGATIISIGFYFSYQRGISVSIFLATGTGLYYCLDPLKRMIRLYGELQRTRGALDRIEQVMQEPNTLKEPVNPALIRKLDGHVKYDDVRFAYDKLPVLDGINLNIAQGTVCALVGPSGAGKSTFAKLLPRFYDPQSGSIQIDGTDIRDLSLQVLRENIAIVPQKPVLFNTTIAENIALARPDASEQSIRQAARNAHASDFIEALESGYDTVVGEDAVRLSGGQKQRLALARAFLKDAPILILDEATSALDSESEKKIQDALQLLLSGKTVFIIAHRFSTLQLADTILVFDKGKIVGQGTHIELIENSGLYQRLYNQQMQNG